MIRPMVFAFALFLAPIPSVASARFPSAPPRNTHFAFPDPPWLANVMGDSLDYSGPPDGALFVTRQGVVLLGYNYYNGGWMRRLSRSTDYGQSFTAWTLGSGYHVDVCLHGNGRDSAYYLSMLPVPFPPGGNHLFLRRSMDAGATWGDSARIDSGPGYYTTDKPMFKTKGGFLLCTYTNATGGEPHFIRVCRSTDWGQTWNSGFQNITNADGHGSCPAIAPNDHAYVAWSQPPGSWGDTIYFSRSTDYGAFWSNPQWILLLSRSSHLSSCRASNTFPSMTVDSNGKIYLVVQHSMRGTGWDVAVITSTNEGVTWAAPVRVNDDPIVDSDQICPWIALDYRNRPHVFWYDNRNYYPTNSGDVYYSFSTDGGTTWARNERVNDVTPCWTQNSFSYMGDYQQIGCDSIWVYCEWSDHRNGHDTWSYIATARRPLPPSGVEEATGSPWKQSLFYLSQNAPNPVLDGTNFSFQLEKTSRASLRIYDLTGKLVRTVLEGSLPAGFHNARWDARDDTGRPVASGVYFYRLESGGLAATRKLVVAR